MKTNWSTPSAAKIAFAALAIFTASILQTYADSAPVPEDFRWRGRLKPGTTIQIKGVSGAIRAERSATEEVEVVAVKQGGGTLNEVRVQAIEYGGGVMFCAIYPAWDATRAYDCRPTSETDSGDINAEVNGSRANIQFPGGGGGEIRMIDVRVDFVVRVPRGIRFVAHTVFGDINARSLDSDVTARNVFGNVLVDIPDAASANVQARTKLGGISSDFPLRFKSAGFSGQSATGTIGSGRCRFDLNSVMGTIGLRHAR